MDCDVTAGVGRPARIGFVSGEVGHFLLVFAVNFERNTLKDLDPKTRRRGSEYVTRGVNCLWGCADRERHSAADQRASGW
jgi:hypothetical protein